MYQCLQPSNQTRPVDFVMCPPLHVTRCSRSPTRKTGLCVRHFLYNWQRSLVCVRDGGWGRYLWACCGFTSSVALLECRYAYLHLIWTMTINFQSRRLCDGTKSYRIYPVSSMSIYRRTCKLLAFLCLLVSMCDDFKTSWVSPTITDVI